jgi:hypothetical protein
VTGDLVADVLAGGDADPAFSPARFAEVPA